MFFSSKYCIPWPLPAVLLLLEGKTKENSYFMKITVRKKLSEQSSPSPGRGVGQRGKGNLSSCCSF